MTITKLEFVDPAAKTADKVVAIASSKGGIKALQLVLNGLPANFDGSIIIVQHLSSLVKSHLDSILDRATSLEVITAFEGANLLCGKVYVAPSDHHVVVNSDRSISLSGAPKEHFVRPSAEYTFKSLANVYQSKAIAVVLTGYDGDGREGVQVIKAKGGKVIAQDKATSVVFGMPESAIETGCVDLILPIDKIADGIIKLMSDL